MRKKNNIFVKDLKVSDETIRIFSYKGSIILLTFLIVGSLIIPLMIQPIGVSSELSVVIGTTIFGGFGTSYVRHFIDSKKGLSVSFYVQLIIFSIIFFTISYAWMYLGFYI